MLLVNDFLPRIAGVTLTAEATCKFSFRFLPRIAGVTPNVVDYLKYRKDFLPRIAGVTPKGPPQNLA